MGLKTKVDLTPVWDVAPIKKRKGIITIPVKKEKVIKDAITPFMLYKEKVDELTESIKHLIDGFETRGWRNYHIDHKLSIKWGFYNNIPVEHIAHIDNLRMLWWKDNMLKNCTCYVDTRNGWICEGFEIYK